MSISFAEDIVMPYANLSKICPVFRDIRTDDDG